jgi:hypothetical protein
MHPSSHCFYAVEELGCRCGQIPTPGVRWGLGGASGQEAESQKNSNRQRVRKRGPSAPSP